MPFGGLDIHKKVVEAALIDDDGRLLSRHRFAATRWDLEWFARSHLSPEHRVALEATTNTWAAVAALEPHVAEVVVSNPLHTRAIADRRIKLLMTLPGVDLAVAQTLVATLGDVSRFRNGDKAAAYLGLAPSTRQSADHCYHGPITKQGRSHARWLVVQAAQHLDSHPGPLGVFFRRLARRKNRNIAVVATARKLVTIAWNMLQRQEPYRYAQPTSTQAKFARLRKLASGARRRGGVPKGTPRPANYRAVP